MKRARTLKTVGVVALSALVVAAAVLAPGWIFGLEDKALLSAQHARVMAGGRLAPDAQDIYIVNALWARQDAWNASGETGRYPEEYYSWQSQMGGAEQEEIDFVRGIAQQHLEKLDAAGVLPQPWLGELWEVFHFNWDQSSRSIDSFGFENMHVSSYYPDAFIHFAFQQDSKTQMLVSMYTTFPSAGPMDEATLAAISEAYRTMLGLDVLDDWQPVWQDWMQEYLHIYGMDMADSTEVPVWEAEGMTEEEYKDFLMVAEMMGLTPMRHYSYSEKAKLLVETTATYRDGYLDFSLSLQPRAQLGNGPWE